jgi:hypothetical protein
LRTEIMPRAGADADADAGEDGIGRHAVHRRAVCRERASGVRGGVPLQLLGRAAGDHAAAGFTAFGSEVHDPLRRADDIEVVLDHHQ